MQYHYRIHKNVDIKLITCFLIICVYDQIKFVKCEPKYICNCHQDVPVNERKFSSNLIYIYKTLLVLGLAPFVLVIVRDRMVVGFTTTCAISAYQK